MDLATMSDFEKGNTKSQTAERTRYRGVRRLRERSLLRRERLHRVLNIIGFLPEHYAEKIGWNRDDNKTYGKFIDYSEPKLQWKEIDNGDFDFLFKSSYNEMLSDFTKHQPLLLSDDKKVPYDWTIYYLRKKALTEKISKEELAWVLLNFNKKRGYYQLREEDEEKHKYFRYIDRVFFVKSADGSELGFSDDNKLVEVEKEKDAEAIVIRLNNVSAEIEYFLRTLMFLNPENHSSILECVISARMGSLSSSTDNLLDLLVDSELILDYWGEYYKAVLIKI